MFHFRLSAEAHTLMLPQRLLGSELALPILPVSSEYDSIRTGCEGVAILNHRCFMQSQTKPDLQKFQHHPLRTIMPCWCAAPRGLTPW